MKVKEYIERRARINQVNNTGVGRVLAIAEGNRYTVELEGGRTMMVYSASGATYGIGEAVSIRYLGKDKRQAEIAGRTTRRLTTARKQVFR